MSLSTSRPRPTEDDEDLVAAMDNFDVNQSSVVNVIKSRKEKVANADQNPVPSSTLNRVLKEVVVERSQQTGQRIGNVKKSGKSIFAQRHRPKVTTSSFTSTSTSTLSSSMSSLKSELSSENSLRLAHMSSEAIDEARRDVMKTLSPQSVNFLMNRSRKSKDGQDEQRLNPETGSRDVEGQDQREVHEERLQQGQAEEQLRQEQRDKQVSQGPDGVFEGLEQEEGDHLDDLNRRMGSRELVVSSLVLDIASQFPNLGTIERDKLQWTADADFSRATSSKTNSSQMNSSKVDLEQGARFDLKGQLVFKSGQSHLYHHGEEPHRPGYTVEELLTLARSTHVPQQVLAMETLALIVLNHKCGYFVSRLTSNVLEALLGRGQLLFLLRSALDNNARFSLRESASFCLSHILYNYVDELALDNDFSSERGHVQPILKAMTNQRALKDEEEKRVKVEDEEQSLRDIEVLRRDVVEGFVLRLDLARRLNFLFTHSPSNCTTSSLRILIRLARHSEQIAVEVFSSFEPSVIPQLLHRSVEGKDKEQQTLLLKWLRVTLQWNNKQLNASIMDSCNLEEVIARAVAVETKERRALELLMEALRTWTTAMLLGYLEQLFVDLFPLLINQLVATRAFLETNEPKLHLHVVALWFKVVHTSILRSDKSIIQQRHLADIIALMRVIVETTVRKWTKNVDQDDEESVRTRRSALLLLSAGLPVLTANAQRSKSCSTELLRSIIEPLMKSELWHYCMNKCSAQSTLLLESLTTRIASLQPQHLPSIEVIGATQSLMGISPFHLLTTVTDCLLSVEDDEQLFEKLLHLLNTEQIKKYISSVLKSTLQWPKVINCPWSEAEEIRLLANIVMLQCRACSRDLDTLSLNLSTVLMELLTYRHDTELCNAILKAHFELLNRVRRSNEKIDVEHDQRQRACHLYSKLLNDTEDSDSKRGEQEGRIVVDYCSRRLSSDWLMSPIHRLFVKGYKDDDREKVVLCLSSVLDHLLSLEGHWMTRIGMLTRVSQIFMLETALFMDSEINDVLLKVLKAFLAKENDKKTSFHYALNISPWPSLSYVSCQHYYDAFVQQFKAVSYNETVFTLYLLIMPIFFPKEAKKEAINLLWAENLDVITPLRLNEDHLRMSGLELNAFKFQECDGIKRDVFECALRQLCEKRNPVLYNIAKINAGSSNNH